MAKKKGNKNSQPHFSTSILVFGNAEEELYEALDDSKEKKRSIKLFFLISNVCATTTFSLPYQNHQKVETHCSGQTLPFAQHLHDRSGWSFSSGRYHKYARRHHLMLSQLLMKLGRMPHDSLDVVPYQWLPTLAGSLYPTTSQHRMRHSMQVFLPINETYIHWLIPFLFPNCANSKSCSSGQQILIFIFVTPSN